MGVGALTALVAMLTASAPAPARTTPLVNVELVGSLTIAWQGDEARGCAAEGLCGVSGSIQMLPSGEDSGGPGAPPIELVDPNSVARVTEASASGAADTTCADLVPTDFILGVKRTNAGVLRAVLEAGDSNQLPSAGRCAGPTATDLSALALPARRLGRHGDDLSGQTTFGAGPFTVTAISTVRALFGTGSLGGIGSSTGTVSTGSSSPAPGFTTLEEHAEVDYRIEGLRGALSTTFAGLAAPLCEPLGACGTTGSLDQSFSTGGVLSFGGSRTVKRREGSRTALEDLRAGRLDLSSSFGASPIEETVTETLAEQDGATCSDRQTQPQLSSASNSVGRHAFALVLGPNEQAEGGAGTSDPLRTRCPGPSEADVLGSSPLAQATIPASALGDRRLTIAFLGGGSFTGGDYGGARAGSVILSLRLEHASGGTTRERFGPPVLPVP